MIASQPSTTVLPEGDVRRARSRARARLYVLCQSGGWLGVLALQLVFVIALATRTEERDRHAAIAVMLMAEGLLLTHGARHYVTRWGWKKLGWRRLVPRVLALCAGLALVWTAAGFAYTRGVLGVPWDDQVAPWIVLGGTWLNGTVVLAGWFGIYFSYHLFDRYSRLQIEQLQLAAHAKEAELRAIKSQINPHFIFNALNSLRALIDENPARAREAVTQLANLLRYSLQSAQSETVAFEDELRVVNDYLALEQVRHEERLRVRFEIEPATLSLAVPPLLLQTLVENAVKYGISPRPEGGEIVISARCVEGLLELRVINPGELLSPSARCAAGPAAESTGLGLNNARERLRMFFGDRARLQLRVESGPRVVAEVSIPVRTARA